MTDWEKRAAQVFRQDAYMTTEARRLALQLGQEMADARAEEIAKAIEDGPYTQNFRFCETVTETRIRAAEMARSRIHKPRTREQVLEEAVVQLRKLSISDIEHDLGIVERITRRALEWKP